jgi:hypothetical protein
LKIDPCDSYLIEQIPPHLSRPLLFLRQLHNPDNEVDEVLRAELLTLDVNGAAAPQQQELDGEINTNLRLVIGSNNNKTTGTTSLDTSKID